MSYGVRIYQGAMATSKEFGDQIIRGQVPGSNEAISRVSMSDQCLDDHGIVSEEAQHMSVGVVDGICNLHCTSYQENEPVKDTKPQELPQHLKVDGIFTEEELEQPVDEACLEKIAMYCHVYRVVWIRLARMLEVQPVVADTLRHNCVQGDEEFLCQLFHAWWSQCPDKRVCRLVKVLCEVGMRDAINELKRYLIIKKLKEEDRKEQQSKSDI
ncbi:uncharacterized protein LOC112556444 [Pomacea canaliculata]|uniref:uncharacterized protein LOC112556444 n=1 Tax=Pomacea canaliculata TaxID=400727 RepID=UPI000D727307|nr:uncharacterized protein LOC112556444 [Pomacea canaliculata]XP_025081246.1 uncharacterized protein LOC112556444 [Pomacea canaliculata]